MSSLAPQPVAVAQERHWLITDRGDNDARRLVDGEVEGCTAPHYSRQTPGARMFTRNGQNLVFITGDGRAVWVTFRPTPGKAVRTDGLDAWECALFRNEGRVRSSRLIREAVALTRALWGREPADGLITFIRPDRVATGRPGGVVGYCYRRAGWKHRGYSTDGKPRFVAPRGGGDRVSRSVALQGRPGRQTPTGAHPVAPVPGWQR